MASDGQSEPRPSKKIATYGKTPQKRPHSSAFPQVPHDGKTSTRYEGMEASESRLPKSSKPPVTSTAQGGGHIAIRAPASRERAQRPRRGSDWDPYDIHDIDGDGDARPKPPVESRREGKGFPLQTAVAPRAKPAVARNPSGTLALQRDDVRGAGKVPSEAKRSPTKRSRVDGRRHALGSTSPLASNPPTCPTLPRDRVNRSSRQGSLPAGPAGKGRARLIDALADQAEEGSSSSSLSEEDDTGPAVMKSTAGLSTPTPARSTYPRDSAPSTVVRSGSVLKSQGVKRTYGAQRSMLRDASFGEEGAFHDFNGSFSQPTLPSPTKMASVDFLLPEEESEGEIGSKGAIRSIHELRRAGANNRFADEMDDLFERIGAPSPKTSSMRRNALLELATKMCGKGFVRQFRDHGIHNNVFGKIGQEQDIISGFALISTLLPLLPSSADYRLAKQLQAGGISSLLKKLLGHSSDIDAIANQRRMNLPRSTQSAVSSLKASVVQLSIWDPTLSEISPRSLALKFVDVCCKPGQATSCIDTLGDLSGELFSILGQYLQPGFTGAANARERHDCLVAASILEAHSSIASDTDPTPRWTWNFLPIITNLLAVTLERPTSQLGALETTVLKLAMNSTNNNPSASQALENCSLFQDLAEASCACFDLVKSDVEKGLLNTDAFNRLILILGVMINFCEHRSSTEPLVAGPALDKLILIYLDSHSSTREADSVEKSQLNVAVGYLAILLGYLSLSDPIRSRFNSMNKGGGLECLVESIREFMAFFESVDGKTGSGNHVARLERLTDALLQAPL